MTQVEMPEPVAQQIRYYDSDLLSPTYRQWSDWEMFTGQYRKMGGNAKRGLITTTQAEAYADARVREAFEGAIAALETCRTTGAVRNITVDACVAKVRGLIPGQHAIDAAKAKQT